MTIQLESVSDAALAMIALNGYREQLDAIAAGHFRLRPASERIRRLGAPARAGSLLAADLGR